MFQEHDSVMVCDGPYNTWIGYVQSVNAQENTIQLLLFDNDGNSIDHVCDVENVLNVEAAPELLEACKAFAYYWEDPQSRGAQLAIETMEKVKQAIAKAEQD